MRRIAAVLALLLAVAALTGCAGGYVVGARIKPEAITEFYWTESTSTNPPYFQRYRLMIEGEQRTFYHEKREGDHWPLRESDVTVSGALALTEAQWDALYACLAGGAAAPRGESASAGDSGPWTYLYWTGDRGKIQEFTFASYEQAEQFERLCIEFKGAQMNGAK